MLAINGINFEKLYNDAKTQAEIESNIKGDGGSKPPISSSDINTNYPKDPSILQAIEISQQDLSIRNGFAIAYSAALLTLTIVSGVLAFFTRGISVAAVALDIAFCGMEIVNAWEEYYLACDVKKY